MKFLTTTAFMTATNHGLTANDELSIINRIRGEVINSRVPTGVILRFRPKTLCGIMGTALSFVSLFFQGDLWPWQLLITTLVTVVTLIIPGHMFNKYVKNYGI